MAIPSIQLNRNLRKNILQGSPWIYKDNLIMTSNVPKTTLCKVKDSKNQFICWGFYSPSSPLAIRVLRLDTSPPNERYYSGLLSQAYKLRGSFVNDLERTNAFRLINGEGDYLPGMICDVYNTVAVLQFDGEGPYEFWDQDFISGWILENTHCETVYFKPRHDSNFTSKSWGKPLTDPYVEICENHQKFYVDIINGQKTGFFLDQRDNRDYLGHLAKGKSVVNLFSYTGGFSIYAGANQATLVKSVDIAQGALDLAQSSWNLNQLEDRHQTVCADVFEFLKSDPDKYDLVICDPPSLAKSESQKSLAIQKYVEAFSLAARKVKTGGHLVISSCSSHIDFNDFEDIANQSISNSRKRGQTLRVSGQGFDHPYLQASGHLRYLKFMDIILH